MQVQLRYFAIVREKLGRADETRKVEQGTTAGELFDQLAADYPALEPMKRATMLMVNQE
jgi:molybdopterin converting factor small subunit